MITRVPFVALNTVCRQISQNSRSSFLLRNSLPSQGSCCGCQYLHVPLSLLNYNICGDVTRRNRSSISNHDDRIKQTVGREKEHCDSKVEFKTIYRFSYIVQMRLMCRLKLYQTGMLLLGLPPVYYLHTLGSISAPMLHAFMGVGTFAGIMLYIMGEYFRRVIGMIGVNASMTSVRVSHLTFWGNRRDITMDAKDIIPLGDGMENVNEIYVLFTRYSTKSALYLFHQHGIIDTNKMSQLIK